MKEALRYGFTLAIICLVSGALLAGMNSLSKSRIISQALAEEVSALKEVMPKAQNFSPVKKGEDIIYYKASDKENKLIGTAFKASGKGYSGMVETLVGMNNDGTINAIKILSQNETPGLGGRISEPFFAGQFTNKNIKGLNEVQAITGATISSKAVIDSVKEKAEEIQLLIQNEK